MYWKIIAAICFALTLVIAIVWIAHGRQTLTKDKTQVITKKTNDFGVEDEIIEWKDDFRLGLDFALPAGGVTTSLSVMGLFMARRRKKLAERG